MTVGSIIGLNPGETDLPKIVAAVRQLLERNGGKQVNAAISASSAYTASASDFMIEVTGNTTITLPVASAAPGQMYCIKKMDASNTTTIGATVDGSASPTLTAQYATWLVHSDGAVWNSIVKYVSPVSTAGLLLNTNNLSDVSNPATALSNLGAGSAATHPATDFLLAANNLSDVTAATARSNLVAATKSQPDHESGILSAVGNGTVFIIEKIPHAATLTAFTARVVSGTITATLNIGGTPVTGGVLNLTTSQQTASPSAANVMASGDALSMVLTSNSAAGLLTYTVAYTKTLA